MNWLTRFRVHRLRKAKAIRLRRFELAMENNMQREATKHRRAAMDYQARIARLTGQPEPAYRRDYQ